MMICTDGDHVWLESLSEERMACECGRVAATLVRIDDRIDVDIAPNVAGGTMIGRVRFNVDGIPGEYEIPFNGGATLPDLKVEIV